MHSVWDNKVTQSEPVIRYGSFRKNSLIWIGRRSLEIYLLHGFTLNLLQNEAKPMFSISVGIGLAFVNYCITVILTFRIITLIERNCFLN